MHKNLALSLLFRNSFFTALLFLFTLSTFSQSQTPKIDKELEAKINYLKGQKNFYNMVSLLSKFGMAGSACQWLIFLACLNSELNFKERKWISGNAATAFRSFFVCLLLSQWTSNEASYLEYQVNDLEDGLT